MWPRLLKWLAGALLAPIVLATLFITVFGWDWLRAPIERIVLEKTGRELAISGPVELGFSWPSLRLRSGAATFANPAWARERQMIRVETVDVAIDLVQLLRHKLVFPEMKLERPAVFLEQGADGRKNWLLDIEQRDETARIQIGRVSIDRAQLGFEDAGQQTRIAVELSTVTNPGKEGGGEGLAFTAKGRYKAVPLKARGQGGPVLALRDETTPYPVTIDVTLGRTGVKANGTVTGLLKLSALDMQLDLRGDSLAQLFPLLGISFPETRAYSTRGRLLHGDKIWRYEAFSGRIGATDIAGNLRLDNGGKRPALKADLVSSLLDLADLGPLIGARRGSLEAAKRAASPSSQEAAPTVPRVLPDLPFTTARWDSVDAEVSLKAKTIRADDLPLDDLDAHLSLRDSVLTLDPLNFGVAGGQLDGVISLDGRQDPILATAKVRARKILLARLFPAAGLDKTSIGQINGTFDLSGTGNSVRNMLGTSSGKVGLVVARGEVSRLMMERAGLHLWEILELNVTGDKLVKLRCAVADFEVKQGVMQAEALVFDTEITTIIGTGSIDLRQETLDLTLNQKTKDTSPLALRSPIRVRGSFARPEASVNKAHVAARAFGALALAMVNPLLALLPLIDAGPGSDSECGQLIREARALPRPDPKKSGPRTRN